MRKDAVTDTFEVEDPSGKRWRVQEITTRESERLISGADMVVAVAYRLDDGETLTATLGNQLFFHPGNGTRYQKK
jgi:hypothetical protein